MIKNIYIKNYALLEDITIDFSDSFTVISGETGAGKTILLDAICLLLGRRVEHSLLNLSNSKCIVEGTFLLNVSHEDFFKKYNLDFDKETVIRREITTSGKNRSFINDTPVLLNILSEFNKQIIEIFAQNQTVILKDENEQFKLLTQLTDSNKELINYKKCYNQYNQLIKDLNTIKSQGNISEAEIDFLQHQYQEIDKANIQINEKKYLEEKISFLENIDGISKVINSSSKLISNEENGIINYLNKIRQQLNKYDNLSQLKDRINSILIELNDINNEFSIIHDSLDTEPEELTNMNNRLDLINMLLQKHKLKFIDQLIELKEDFNARIELSKSFDVLLKEKKQQINLKKEELGFLATKLNEKRLKKSPEIERNIIKLLNNLGMPFAIFKFDIIKTNEFHSNGNSVISIQFSANKGNKLQNLSKIASGGELSRLMLAIKYITAEKSNIGTLIFDEIDSGVSGEVASLMGDMMRNIGATKQLITISHLPQIVSKAKTHLKVVKSIKKDRSISTILKLNKKDRIREIAKLLSGKKVSQAAIDNAVDMLNQ